MVSFATGEKPAGNASMIIGTVLILLFIAYAGLRGVASAAYFKDVAIVVCLLVVLFGVLMYFSGDWGGDCVMAAARDKLTVDSGSQTYGITWFITSVIVSGIGLGGMTLPESWPAVLAADGSRAVSKNHVMLPLYTPATFIPIAIGFYAASHVTVGEGADDSVIPSPSTPPSSIMGCVLIARISCAIVLIAHCVLSIAPWSPRISSRPAPPMCDACSSARPLPGSFFWSPSGRRWPARISWRTSTC